MKRILLLCCLFIGLTAASYSQTAKKTTTDPVEKAKGLQKELKLTDSQTSKIAAVYKESSEKFDKIKVADNGNTDKMMKDIGPLRTATIKKIKTILTPVQAANYDKLIKENKGGKSNGWSDGWSATSEN
jgi:spermidine/putrescine-binding protein